VARQIPEASSDGRIRQPSWGRLGLEVVTDLIGWVAVFAILQAVGTAALKKITGPSLVWELLFVLILFFVVTLIVRVGFIFLARRAVQ
jgi:hypothetical protein